MESKLVILAGTVLACIVCCSAMPTAATTTDTMAPNASSNATPLELFNEVIKGVKVTERLNIHYTQSFGISTNNATLERGFYAFSVLYQAMNTIDMLSRHGISSDSLASYRIVIDGVMNDTCKWFASQINGTLDCNSPSSMATLYLTLRLKPHLSNLGCFVTSLPNLQTGQELNDWVPRTFSGQDSNLECRVCSALKLKNCSCNE